MIMASDESIAYTLFSLWLRFIVPTFLILIIILLALAAMGASLGIRERYVKLLLKVFEYGQRKIKKAEMKIHRKEIEMENDDDEKVNLPTFQISNGSNTVISREGVQLVPNPEQMKGNIPRNRSFNTFQTEFKLDDAMHFIKAGVEAIIEDEVTKRFTAEEIRSWNLLTRTNKNYHYISLRLTILWGLGFILRYFFLLPSRLVITFLGVGCLVTCTAVIGCIPEGRVKKFLYWNISLMCFRVLGRAFSAIVTYHNRENRAKGGGICVANHTSPIDVVILASDNCYALVGQRQGGFLGVLQRALARATSHIWFERFEMKDRAIVTQRLKEHVEDPEKLPILIFPEGTCINNTSVMMFKKGSFEVGGTIYPVAIKYDSKFGDAFWNSNQQGYMHYLLMMMTSWAIVCDVWYLPPMTRQPEESAIDFANRVKGEISRRGGLVDLMWDGQLKRMKVKREWKEQQQIEYSKRIKIQ